MRKEKKKTWHTLKDEKCPQCSAPLTKGMFDIDYIQCGNACGFIVKDDVKKLLVNRDHMDERDMAKEAAIEIGLPEDEADAMVEDLM